MCCDWPPLKHQTSAEELLWSEWDYKQSINGQGLISHSKWVLRSFYYEHHSHTYLSALTNMRTHTLTPGFGISPKDSNTGGSRLKPPTFPLVDFKQSSICSISTAAENRNMSVKYRFHYLNSYLFYFYWSYFKWYSMILRCWLCHDSHFFIDIYIYYRYTGYIYLFLAAVDKDFVNFWLRQS